ncbi:MAG: polyprenyl synthetase family protein [Candidatus Bathyarchaeota archaeon]|nr:MAG: polyprenyl synthetase family protein [Candidatus Bathyarchaeota archaeon]
MRVKQIDKETAMSVIELLTKRGKLIDDFLLKMLKLGASSELYEMAKHQIAAGGKRVRPAMTVLCCEAVGGSDEAAIPAAAGIELIHNYTLIFDDIIDRSDLRRGLPTLRAVYGDVMAFLAGMHYREAIFEAARRSAKAERIEKLFSLTIRKIIEGERLDVLYEQGGRGSEYISKMRFKHVSEDDYRRMIEAKTAVLFEAACKAGGVAGGGRAPEIYGLSRYGWNCGVAFQMKDDILDIVGETERLGKPAGKDIEEHKLGNIVVLNSLEELSKPERDEVLQTLRSQKISDSAMSNIMELISSTKAVERAYEKTKFLAQRAQMSLNALPPSEAKHILLSLADFIIERTF